MATDLTTGQGLCAAVADTLNRQDLLSVIPSWVRMGEAQIGRVLRIREMIKRSTAVTSDDYITVPSDFLELKSLHLVTPNGRKRALKLTSNDELLDLDVRAAHAEGFGYITLPACTGPTHYSVLDGTFRLAPPPVGSVTLEVVYYGALPALDCDTFGASNWLLLKAPDLYLYSTLVFSAPYLNEDDRAQMWSQLASSALQGLNDQSEKAEHSGSRLNAPLATFRR